MKENNIVYSRIIKEYSFKVLIREIMLLCLIFLFNLSYPTAFDFIGYPFYFMMVLVLTSILIYLPIMLIIKNLILNFEKNLEKILTIDKYFFFLNNISIGILIPAFGTYFINIFWFITTINFCILFVSPYFIGKKIYIMFAAPIVSVIIHYLIYLPQDKELQSVEIGFSFLMSFILFYTYSIINQKKLYDKILFNEDETINNFVTSKNFTEREKEIFTSILKGYSTKKIAQEFFISPGTVRNHISNIFLKTSTHSRMELFSEFNRI